MTSHGVTGEPCGNRADTVVRDRFVDVMTLLLPVSPAIREVYGENGKGPHA